MIIKLKKNETIEIIKSTIENINEAILYIETEENTSGNDVFRVFLNNFLLNKVENRYTIPEKSIKQMFNVLKVQWMNPAFGTRTFEKPIELNKYISLGGIPVERHPQVILDLEAQINDLKKRVKKLEEEGTVI